MLGIDESLFQQHIYTSGLLLVKALLPTAVTMGGPSLPESVSGITEKLPPSPLSLPAVRHNPLGSFFVYFLGEAFCDSQIGFCLPKRTEIIISKCYKDKNIGNYCDITTSSQCFSRLVFTTFRL